MISGKLIKENESRMIIKNLRTKNYRSLEDLNIEFNPYYNALSGKNNSGKSNVIRALLTFLTYDFRSFRNYDNMGIHFENDYPFWKKKEKGDILVEIEIELDDTLDAGLFKFIKELIFKNEEEINSHKEILKIIATQNSDQKETKIKLIFGGHEITDEYKRDEFLKRLKSSKSILFHNSTENEPFFFTRNRNNSLISYIGKDDKNEISKRKESLENQVKKALKNIKLNLGLCLGDYKTNMMFRWEFQD